MAEIGQSMENSSTIKVGIIGQSAVGKTALIKRIVKDQFDSTDRNSTAGLNTEQYDMPFENKQIHFIFYDTAGQEEYGYLADFYLRDVDVVLLCFDPFAKDAKNGLTFWYDKIKDIKNANQILLVSTKSDLWSNISPLPALVSNEDNLIETFPSFSYYQTSSATKEGISELLQGICYLYFENKVNDGNDRKGDPLVLSGSNSDKKCC